MRRITVKLAPMYYFMECLEYNFNLYSSRDNDGA